MQGMFLICLTLTRQVMKIPEILIYVGFSMLDRSDVPPLKHGLANFSEIRNKSKIKKFSYQHFKHSGQGLQDVSIQFVKILHLSSASRAF